jgi:hypothetical protein
MREPGGSQARHHLAALVCLGLGFWIGYVVWSRQPGLRVPPAVGYLAAGSFAAAGISLFLQGVGFARGAGVSAILATAALASVGGWIGFGSGSRRCGGSIGGIPFITGEWVCRLVFGAGAILTGLIVLLMLRSLFRSDESP